VAARRGPEGVRYDRVCAQGRLEAFREFAQATIPAVAIEAAGEDCLVMSLVENVARRQHHGLALSPGKRFSMQSASRAGAAWQFVLYLFDPLR
jgi:ParB-like chromosome segregation protein Spo0J